MRMEGTIHCSGPECDVSQHVGADTMQLDKLPPGWVVVNSFENNGIVDKEAFHNANCALKWLARIEPPEIITMEE